MGKSGGKDVEPESAPERTEAPAAEALALSRMEATLRNRLAFEELITTLSTQLVSLAVEEVDHGVHEALRSIGEFAHVDRAYVFRFSSDGTHMQNTHEWCAPGIEPVIHLVQNLSLEEFAWWADQVRNRKVIHLPDVIADLPPEATVERASLIEQGVKSVLAVPIIYQGAVVGFLGFDSVERPKTWPSADVALIRIAGELVVSALERKQADESRRVLETQLIQARSMENVARLAGGVAHDFNNLLSIILNYASILHRKIADEEQREQVGELFEAARRAAALTRQLLVMGRRDVVEPVLLDVNDVVRSLQTLLEQLVGEAFDLHLELDDTIGITRIGLPQLEQVLLNLTANARDAMPDGGRLLIETSEIEVDAAYAARFLDFEPGMYLRVRVADTGVGMSRDVASRAFEPFFTTKGRKGTGLGLSTVRAIIEQAGGHIALSSEPSKGTTVDVFLKIVDEGVPVSIVAPAATDAPKGHGETVLVVEDSPVVRKLVCAMLDANGYETLQAPAGPGALELLARHPGAVDLLLTDVVLPEMSGRELAVRAREDHAVPRVLFMSGYHDDIIVHHGMLEPGTQLLQKPFLEVDLLRALSRAFEAETTATS